MPPSVHRSLGAACALAALTVLSMPAGASAAQRYATADASATSGGCAATAPCRVDVAINQAAAGDEVIVAPGTYQLSDELSPGVAIDLHGVAGRPRPRLVDAAGTDPLLRMNAGGTLRHLRLEAGGPQQDALALEGAVGDDLLLLSADGNGATLAGAPATTVLRDSLLRTASASSGSAALRLRNPDDQGDVAVRNVTAIAPAAKAIRCNVTNGQVTLVDTIARGGTADVDAHGAGAHCSASNSSLRAALSPGLPAGSADQEAEPLFVDAANGDYRPAAGSPTIDAGAGDALLGASDPAGCPRTLGLAPDIGAYEHPNPATDACATAPAEPLGAVVLKPHSSGDDQGDDDQGDDVADDTPPSVIHDLIRGLPAPVQGKAMVVAPGQGKVRVRRAGSTRFRTLSGAARVPVGSVLDARAGRVKLVSAVDAAGRLQLGTFWGTTFQVRQAPTGDGTTELVLRGGNFGACRPATAARAVATVSRARHRKVRSLWGRDSHGRYRTHGQNSAATARGTRWLTEDRCDGTLTRVTAGSVAVRDLRRHRTVVVGAGHRYLARAR